MKRLKCCAAVTICALLVLLLSAAVPSEVRAQEPAVNPEATEILKKMTSYLGSLKQFSVETQNTLEDVTYTGQRIDLDVSASVTVSRPNRLHSERKGELLHQVFTYDGKTLTLHNLSENVYATEAVPDTFEGMFKYLYESLGFGLPVSDLIYGDAFPLLMEDVTSAAVAGKTYIDGVRCDHLLFSRPGVDFQVWVEDGGIPLPRKYVVTDTSYPGLMSISTVMSDWNVNPTVNDADFTFTPPAGAQAIDFLPF